MATASSSVTRSWFHPEVYELLRAHSVGLVIGDRPQVHAFQSLELTADWTFVRFHYGTRGLRGNYSERTSEPAHFGIQPAP